MNTRTRVTERIQRAYMSLADGDIEELMTLYEPDAVLQNPGALPLVGLDALRAFWSKTFSQATLRVTLDITDVDDFGEVVVARGRVVGVSVARANGAEAPVDSWFLQIYKRQSDGSFRFWRGANGPNPPRS